MNQELLTELYKEYQQSNVQITMDQLLFGTKFYRDGIHTYGKSRYFTKGQIQALLDFIHPRLLEQNVHIVFIPNRLTFIKEIFSSDSDCRKDKKALLNRKEHAVYQTESDTFLYIYEFNLEKKWEQTYIVAIILTYLYENSHANMKKEKRKRKREKYINRMIHRIQANEPLKKELLT